MSNSMFGIDRGSSLLKISLPTSLQDWLTVTTQICLGRDDELLQCAGVFLQLLEQLDASSSTLVERSGQSQWRSAALRWLLLYLEVAGLRHSSTRCWRTGCRTTGTTSLSCINCTSLDTYSTSPTCTACRRPSPLAALTSGNIAMESVPVYSRH
ncbi:hypothetical protein BU23DRAFT_301593 [Bimuria novae-zelandiae CBS 107.79]|uniref:Uncharacterized protein n=1 Tax=Bimuria novae-zelandiae CBS 107.79 TaxID=1447943 RepID=A0A6A5UWI9_9PLEO|nr:hypothetical protein BU23DRAFT_301593 [Bimuria novae-zelandiae CBS 107.79]